jgi:hypothetical protein
MALPANKLNHTLPYYQVVGAACSFGVLLFTRTRERTIQLPSGVAEGEVNNDPFDVFLPEDAIDGSPIEEDKYWTQACTSLCHFTSPMTFEAFPDAYSKAAAHPYACGYPYYRDHLPQLHTRRAFHH